MNRQIHYDDTSDDDIDILNWKIDKPNYFFVTLISSNFNVYPISSVMKKMFISKITIFDSLNYIKLEPKNKIFDYRWFETKMSAIQTNGNAVKMFRITDGSIS